MLVVSELWGSRQEKKALLSAAAAELFTTLVWVTAEHRRSAPLSLRRSATVVTRYSPTKADLPVPSLSLGDIEDVL